MSYSPIFVIRISLELYVILRRINWAINEYYYRELFPVSRFVWNNILKTALIYGSFIIRIPVCLSKTTTDEFRLSIFLMFPWILSLYCYLRKPFVSDEPLRPNSLLETPIQGLCSSSTKIKNRTFKFHFCLQKQIRCYI